MVVLATVCPNLYNACTAIHAVVAPLWDLCSLVQEITCKVRENSGFDTLFCVGCFCVELGRISLRRDLGVALK